MSVPARRQRVARAPTIGLAPRSDATGRVPCSQHVFNARPSRDAAVGEQPFGCAVAGATSRHRRGRRSLRMRRMHRDVAVAVGPGDSTDLESGRAALVAPHRDCRTAAGEPAALTAISANPNERDAAQVGASGSTRRASTERWSSKSQQRRSAARDDAAAASCGEPCAPARTSAAEPHNVPHRSRARDAALPRTPPTNAAPKHRPQNAARRSRPLSSAAARARKLRGRDQALGLSAPLAAASGVALAGSP
jgi:hypothetical protein